MEAVENEAIQGATRGISRNSKYRLFCLDF